MLHDKAHKKRTSSNIVGTLVVAAFFLAVGLVVFRESMAVSSPDAYLATNSGNVDLTMVEELFAAISVKRLNQIADQYKEEYADKLPFPHIAIDGIFPQRFIEEVERENGEDRLKQNCVEGTLKCFRNRRTEYLKSALTTEDLMGPYTRILFGAMKSSNFINFLERLTTIQGILPDPHYRGSGVHFTATGGFLDIHADFNRYEGYKLDRRVNAFVFLNNDWDESYGGHLELWNREMTQCAQRVSPILGRFLVFSTTDFSYHGHPNALTAPPGRARRSMALYYYTNGRPAHECLDGDCSGEGHTTLFQKPNGCKRCEEQTCRAYNEDESIPKWIAEAE